MARFCVTGGAGFIGSHIAEYLVRLREDVIVLDDCSAGTRANVANVSGQLRFVEADCCDTAAVRDAVAGCDYVLHQAARTSVPQSLTEPVETFRVNVTGTLTVLEAARAAGVKRVVLASSSSIYGNAETGIPAREDATPAPLSPYAASKTAMEYLGRCYSASMKLPCISLRYFNVFGPRQDPESDYAAVVPKFATALLRGELPTIYGDGEQTRDFTFVENVVDANRLACEAATDACGIAYNIACGDRISLNALLRTIGEIVGHEVQADYVDPRPGDIRHSMAGIELATERLGFRPRTGWVEGLRRTIEAS